MDSVYSTWWTSDICGVVKTRNEGENIILDLAGPHEGYCCVFGDPEPERGEFDTHSTLQGSWVHSLNTSTVLTALDNTGLIVDYQKTICPEGHTVFSWTVQGS